MKNLPNSIQYLFFLFFNISLGLYMYLEFRIDLWCKKMMNWERMTKNENVYGYSFVSSELVRGWRKVIRGV